MNLKTIFKAVEQQKIHYFNVKFTISAVFSDQYARGKDLLV